MILFQLFTLTYLEKIKTTKIGENDFLYWNLHACQGHKWVPNVYMCLPRHC